MNFGALLHNCVETSGKEFSFNTCSCIHDHSGILDSAPYMSALRAISTPSGSQGIVREQARGEGLLLQLWQQQVESRTSPARRQASRLQAYETRGFLPATAMLGCGTSLQKSKSRSVLNLQVTYISRLTHNQYPV